MRASIWMVLVISFAIDLWLGEGAISGYGDVGHLEGGTWSLPGPEPRLWLPIIGLLLFQGFWVFIQLKLQKTASNQFSMRDASKF